MKPGWKEIKLGSIFKLEYGKPLPDVNRKTNGLYPVYGANGEKDRTDEFFCDKPSIIVGRKGSAGEINLTESRFWPLDVTYFVTFDDNKYDLRFVYFLLTNLELPKLAKGVKPGINRNEVYSLDVKAPPLAEQRRIVAILDQAFASIDNAKANTEKNLQNVRDLFETYLNSIFGRPGDEWEEKSLGDKNLIEIIDGDRGKNYPKKSDYLGEGFCLFLNTKNVRPDGFNFDIPVFITEKKEKALGPGRLARNDVVMTTRGTIGNLGLFNNDVVYENIRINSGMLIFRPNNKLLTSDYLFEILRSGIIKNQMKKYVSGAAQPQLPIRTLVSFTFPVPKSIKEQLIIVDNLKNIYTETKKLEGIYRKKLSDLDEFRKSFLHKAFNGELTVG